MTLLVSCSIKTSHIITPDTKKDIPVVVKLMDIDVLGNIYVVNNENQLIKYNETGEQQALYYNKRLGDIHSIDVSNPLSILVFFKDFGIVLRLDNTLSEITRLDFSTNNSFEDITAVCLSNDNKYWIYDVQKHEVFKIDEKFNILSETSSLYDVAIRKSEVFKMQESGNNLLVLTKENGIAVFDNYGQHIKTIYDYGIKDFQFDGKQLIYKANTSYKYQKIQFHKASFIGLPAGTDRNKVIKAIKTKYGWVLGYEDGIEIVKK